jgi:DNA segregation ATPase FtsK/SpoIIIE-like protein
MDRHERKEEIDKILHSREEHYVGIRKNIRAQKMQFIMMIGLIYCIITGINAFYGKIPEWGWFSKLYTAENTVKVANMYVAAKVSLLFAMLLFLSKPLFILYLFIRNIIKGLIALGKAIGRLFGKLAENTSIKATDEKLTNTVDEPKKATLKDIELMKKMMKEKLEFSLTKYGMLNAQNSVKKGIEIGEIVKGPTITRYHVIPNDILIKDINSKLQDIALTMSVQNVAMTNKDGKLYFQVPNPPEAREIVYFNDVYDKFYQRRKHILEVPLGVTATGELLVIRIDKLPHLLIAGATGAGKSVCMNVIITSLILNASPEELEFVMIDPKIVELIQYRDIPHLALPIAKSIEEIRLALELVITKMESRYEYFAEHNVKNIDGLHAKGIKLKYMVVVMDEAADITQQDSGLVETSISRIAGKARAAGIFVILGTQRPSVDVITGVIKANMPARIGFNVSSGTDSRTILDEVGAEKLLGKGDGLVKLPDSAQAQRFQGAFISDEQGEYIIEEVTKKYSESKKESSLVKDSYVEDKVTITIGKKPSENIIQEAELVNEKHLQVEVESSVEEKCKEAELFSDVDDDIDNKLLSIICKEKIKGESILPGTTELTDTLERRKSDVLDAINDLIEKGYLERSGGGRGTKTKILVSRDKAIHYLFESDIKSYEEVYDYIHTEDE